MHKKFLANYLRIKILKNLNLGGKLYLLNLRPITKINNICGEMKYFDWHSFHFIVVLIFDGYSEIGVHVRSNHCYSIFLMRLIRKRAIKVMFFFSPKRPVFLHACATCSKLPPYIYISLFSCHLLKQVTMKKINPRKTP